MQCVARISVLSLMLRNAIYHVLDHEVEMEQRGGGVQPRSPKCCATKIPLTLFLL